MPIPTRPNIEAAASVPIGPLREALLEARCQVLPGCSINRAWSPLHGHAFDVVLRYIDRDDYADWNGPSTMPERELRLTKYADEGRLAAAIRAALGQKPYPPGSLAPYLNRRREEAEMSVRRLAGDIGRSPSWVSKVMRGKEVPGYDSLELLRMALWGNSPASTWPSMEKLSAMAGHCPECGGTGHHVPRCP